VYQRVGKPVIFFTVIIIAAIAYLAMFGIAFKQGDTRNVIIAGAQDIRKGIDLNGGVDVTFTPATTAHITQSDLQKAETIINSRLDNLNVLDREVYLGSNNTIIVRFPWKSDEKNFDPESAIQELGSMAQLEFKCTTFNSGNTFLTGKDVDKASVQVENGDYEVALSLKSAGVKKFADGTQNAYTNQSQIVIYMDGKQISSAGVDNGAITGGQATISGGFTADQAKSLAQQINAGSLPFSLKTDNYSTISPTLGKNALSVMLMAGLVAAILIGLFMILYYRLPGFIACIALVGHVAGTVLMVTMFHITLTLPGIAGIILSIGMGVDCNIITAERIKEELRNGKTLDGSIDSGFKRSFSAIFDGNVTVFIVGAILYFLGSATVKSFGYTLVWGVVFNLVMGMVASRLMLKSISKFKFAHNRVLYRGGAAL
jgi:protein-export SecD/SecF family membrane protein